MQRVKRQASNNHNYFANNKKTKLIKENVTHFQDLSNDLFFEIFEYLDYFDIYQSFYDVNFNFRHLVTNSNFPIKINISTRSKWSFHRFYNHIVKHNLHRVQTMAISNVCLYDDVFSTVSNLSKITGLQTLVLEQIESKMLMNLLEQLRSSTSISSISISVIEPLAHKTEIYLQLFRLSTLKFCKLSLGNYYLNQNLSLPFATIHEQCSIEHFILMDRIFTHEIDNLLSYLPQLSRLSLRLRQNSQNERKQSDHVLRHLTHLSIDAESIEFDGFTQMMIDLFLNIQVLNFTQSNCTNSTNEFFKATKWKQLIVSHLKNLHSFNIQLNTRVENTDYDNQFTTSFWIERQWFITHELYSIRNSNYLNLYSIKPYKKRSYTLRESADKNTSIYNDKSNLNSVRHVRIDSKQGLLESIYRFPNATELTLQPNFTASSLALTTVLNRILPLNLLTELVIDCGRFSLKKVMELIQSAPSLHTLKLSSIPLFKDTRETIQQSELFQVVSATNKVRHVIYSEVCKLEDLKLLVALFPGAKQLTINNYAQDLQTNVWFLLDKQNEHTRHLCSLRFTSASKIWIKRLDRLLRSQLLIRNYTLKMFNRQLYLSW